MPGMSGLRKRNRAAFAEAEATAGRVRVRVARRVPSPEPAPQRVGVVTSPGGTSRIAFVDSNGAKRDEEAAEEKELVEIADAGADASGLQPEARDVLQDENAQKLIFPSPGGTSHIVPADSTDASDETSDELENENAGVDVVAVTGANSLPNVTRACGIASGETLGALVDARTGVRVARCLVGDAIVASVKFSETVEHLTAWVQPSIDGERFSQWLREAALTFPSFTVPANVYSMFDDGATGCLREFVAGGDADGDKFCSPLSLEESSFNRLQYNAVWAAAHVLDASDDARSEALELAEAMKNSRRFAVRSTYAWLILCSDGPVLVYIGESKDIETRISTHIDSLFSKPDDAPTVQRGHRVAREHLGGDFKMRLFVVSAHDEASARRLAKSYVDFCGSCGGKSPPSILEVARACAASGFYSEAVYTAAFCSMHEESTDVRIGLNFSQPGVMHPKVMDKLSFQERIKLGLESNRARTQGTTSKNTPQLFFCDVCTTWRVTLKYFTGNKLADGSDECECKNCYEAERYAQGEHFECESCGKSKAGFQKQFLHPDGRKGIQCTACYNTAIKAARSPWTCQQCARSMKGKSERHRHPGGGHQCRMCKNRANN